MVCRWFHYSCAPASSCIDVGSGSWFHCDGCSSLHGLLGQAALSSAEARAASAAAPGGGDKAAVSGAMSGAVSLVLLDLGEIRRTREGEWDGTPEAGAAMRLRDPSALFKTCPRLLQKRQQQQQLGADAGERRGRERLLLCGAAAQRDLAAVARIFSRLVPRDPGDSALEEVGRWGRGHSDDSAIYLIMGGRKCVSDCVNTGGRLESSAAPYAGGGHGARSRRPAN